MNRAPTLTCNHEAPIAAYAIQAGALRENPESGPDGVGVKEGLAYTLEARAEVQAVCASGEISHTLKADGHDGHDGHDGSEDGTGRGVPVVALVQNSRDEVRMMGGDGHVVGALAAEPGAKQQCYIASVALRGRDGGATAELGDEIQNCLRASNGGGDKPHVLSAMQVRRLTPRECLRLQGFPDSYLDVLYRGKPAADGNKYRAIGNSWAVPCASWIGQRINSVLELALQ